MSVAVLEHVGTCWDTRSSSGRECFAICKYGQVTHAWRKYSGSRCRICSHGIEVLLEPSNHRARKVPWKYKRTQVVLLLVSQICIEQCVSMWVRKGGWLKSFGHGSCACSKAGRQGKYDCLGSFSKTSTTILQITELPLKKWTQDYKEFLGNKIARPEDLATKSFHNICLLLVLFVLSGFAFSAHSTHTIPYHILRSKLYSLVGIPTPEVFAKQHARWRQQEKQVEHLRCAQLWNSADSDQS